MATDTPTYQHFTGASVLAAINACALPGQVNSAITFSTLKALKEAAREVGLYEGHSREGLAFFRQTMADYGLAELARREAPKPKGRTAEEIMADAKGGTRKPAAPKAPTGKRAPASPRYAEAMAVRKAAGKRPEGGRKVTDAELAELIAAELAEAPGTPAYQVLEVVYWLGGVALSKARFYSVFEQATTVPTADVESYLVALAEAELADAEAPSNVVQLHG